MQPLDPYTLTLKGSHLIEASAGTGKTYTLTLLFLRFILEKKLSVDQILVVTFTRAATDELRSRIRDRLQQAADFYAGRNREKTELTQWMRKYPAEEAGLLIDDALARMDEASIYTIHGFCQRVLQDNSFESAMVFDMEFIESEKTLRCHIMEDFWRMNFYTASREKTEWVRSLWNEPQRLLEALEPALSLHKTQIRPIVTADQLINAEKLAINQWQKVQGLWHQYHREVTDILLTDACLKRGKKDGYHPTETVPLLIEGVEIMCGREKMMYLLPPKMEMLQQSHLAVLCLKKCKDVPEHPFFSQFEQFYTAHQDYTRLLKINTLTEAYGYLSRELTSRKKMQSQLYFDDLLTLLAEALTQEQNGEKLARQIARQYPAALVDEFQDTDPLQYDIFSSIYAARGSLFMIGDPKQAIYSFRGADIFTYIQARRKTPPAHLHTMGTNYRSTGEMVGAINTIFDRPGGFLFEPDISFYPVDPDHTQTKPSLALDNRPVLPLNVILLENSLAGERQKKISKTNAQTAAADGCAARISSLLMLAEKGKADIGGTRLQAGDIAVLVRTHFEAEAMQKALKRKKITSVYYSRNSVFSTLEARQLLQFLQTLLDLRDPVSCSTALASDLFGLDANRLAEVRSDVAQWNYYYQRLLEYRRVWFEQGIMVMLQKLFSNEKIVQRLTAFHDGERKCTNYFHLSELLHRSPAALDGHAPLIRWFAEQCDRPDPEIEAEQLRLENDEQLVKIVTIHKAKGLEYPVVFLPFLWSGRTMEVTPPLLFHDKSMLSTILDFDAADKHNLERAELEYRAEAVRLLYVALTRARCCIFFCWGNIAHREKSAFYRFLENPEAPVVTADQDIVTGLQCFNDPEPRLSVTRYPTDYADNCCSEDKHSEITLTAKVFAGQIKSGTLITSYSQLVHHRQEQWPNFSTETTAAAAPEQEEKDKFTFPKGATAGTCLHSILEQIDFSAASSTWEETIASTLSRHGIDSGWMESSRDWIEEICSIPLVEDCSLSSIGTADRLDELSFLFPLESFDIQAFNSVLIQYNISPMSTQQKTIRGMMKGFIDLVFCHQDKFYIVDYKSNFLGPSHQDYRPIELLRAMDEHRYDLQYLIYTIALNRYLRSRLENYSYSKRFGGIYYLFLRGMGNNHPSGNGIFFSRPEKVLIETLDQCCRMH